MPRIDLDNQTVAYEEAGADHPDRPALLLVHGFTGSHVDFVDVLESLGQDRRVIAVDLPGHGGSTGPDDVDAYALPARASWVVRFVDALGLGDLHLLGYSLGGLIAQRAAAMASHRLRSLILMDTGLGAMREEASERVVRIAVAARDEGPEAALAASVADEDVAEDERQRGLQRFRQLNPAAVVGGARALVSAVPLGAFLRGIDVPVLVVHGADDEAWTLSEQRLLVQTAAGAEHAIIPDAAHAPQRENPTVWLAVVRDFLRRTDGIDAAG